jgi:hypothetical protein
VVPRIGLRRDSGPDGGFVGSVAADWLGMGSHARERQAQAQQKPFHRFILGENQFFVLQFGTRSKLQVRLSKLCQTCSNLLILLK